MGGAARASGAAQTTSSASVFARFAVKTEAGRTITVPLWQSGGGGAGGSLATCAPAARTYASVLAGRVEPRPESAPRPAVVEGASRTVAPTAVERPDARAPADSDSDIAWLVREEARARERSSQLAARLRAARGVAHDGGALIPEPLGSEEPGDGYDSVHGHESGGVPERVFRASDARKTREPYVPRRRGDVGAAQGGGAGKDASDGPQERPGPGLSKKAPARGAAPGESSSAPPPRKGEKVASRKCSRLRKASAADIGGAGGGSAGTCAVPLPEATAARRGVAGPSGAAPASDPEGEFSALRESVARAAAGAGSRARGEEAPHDPRAAHLYARGG